MEPLANFPIARDLVVDMSDFMEKLPRVKPWIIRDDDVTEIDGEYLQTPEELDAYKQFSMCINCMLCYAACPVYGLDPDFIGPAAIALAERYDLDSRDQGATRAARRTHRARGRVGLHLRRRVHPRVPQARGPGRRHPALQAQGGPAEREGVPPAPGDAMSDLTWRRPISTWWWLRKRTYFVFVMRELSSLFVAWFVLFLLLLVRAVGRGEAAYEDFLDWAASPVVVVINVVAFAFIVLHTVTWFSLTPQAMALQVRGKPVPAWLVIGAQYAGLAVVSAFVWWLVTR